MNNKKFEFAVVPEENAKILPYPYVYIEKDGSYREITDREKMYLEETFHPGDGGRPYVKPTYEKSIYGDISGFISRDLLPKNIIK